MSLRTLKLKNISRDDVEKALAVIRSNPSLRKGRESIEYDLIYDKSLKYPPILVLSEANKLSWRKRITTYQTLVTQQRMHSQYYNHSDSWLKERQWTFQNN